MSFVVQTLQAYILQAALKQWVICANTSRFPGVCSGWSSRKMCVLLYDYALLQGRFLSLLYDITPEDFIT
jgi:hypothetical protein